MAYKPAARVLVRVSIRIFQAFVWFGYGFRCFCCDLSYFSGLMPCVLFLLSFFVISFLTVIF